MEARLITPEGARMLTTDELGDALASDQGIVWVDVDHSDADGMAWLHRVFRVEPFEVEECHMRVPVPKVHLLDDHILTAVNGLGRGADDKLHFTPLKTFLGARRFVSVMGPTNEVLDRQSARREVRELQARVDAGSFLPASAGEIAHALRVTVLRSHEELIAALARRITELERVAMQCDPMRSEPLLQDLFSVRHDLQTIRTNAAHAHEVYVRISESGRLRGTDAQRLSDLRHGFEHARNTADLQRDYLQDLVDLFETRVATELNRFVRQLTAWGAIGLVATLIAGIYGMNFAHMPELNWTYGYPVALGSMILVGLALAAVFRRRGWL